MLAAIFYGIIHDQVTARVCVEYFTIGHPPVFDTTSPTILALGWGVIATWWVGLPLGLGLALAARAGNRPKRDVRSLLLPIFGLLAIMGCCAVVAGVLGSVLATHGSLSLWEPLASRVPEGRHVAFLADLWAHSASYFCGAIGGLVLISLTWRSRYHTETFSLSPG